MVEGNWPSKTQKGPRADRVARGETKVINQRTEAILMSPGHFLNAKHFRSSEDGRFVYTSL